MSLSLYSTHGSCFRWILSQCNFCPLCYIYCFGIWHVECICCTSPIRYFLTSFIPT